MKFYIFTLWLIIIAIYYGVGGEAFPDYLNYVTISQKGGYLFYEDEYLAEWISRFWLSNVGQILGDHYLSVDIFALIVQIAYLIWAFSGKDKSVILVKFWVTVFMGPLLLTTTLRATIPYILFFQLFLGQITIKRIIVLGLLALSFHDSAMVPFFIAFMIHILFKESSSINRKIAQLMYAASVLVVLAGEYLAPTILPLLSSIGLGIRDIYFIDFVPASGFKIAYASLIIIMTGIIFFHAPNERLVLIVISMLCASSVLFAISSTPAIRMYLFVFGACICLLSRGKRLEKIISNPIAIFMIPPLALFVLFYDLFRNANV